MDFSSIIEGFFSPFNQMDLPVCLFTWQTFVWDSMCQAEPEDQGIGWKKQSS